MTYIESSREALDVLAQIVEPSSKALPRASKPGEFRRGTSRGVGHVPTKQKTSLVGTLSRDPVMRFANRKGDEVLIFNVH